MATLRTVPTTKDGVSVATALERTTDSTPFDLIHAVQGTILYGLFQDLQTNGPVIPLTISAVKDQDGKPMLLTRASIREEGKLKVYKKDALFAGTGAKTVTMTVPAGKLWILKSVSMYFDGTATVTTANVYLNSIPAETTGSTTSFHQIYGNSSGLTSLANLIYTPNTSIQLVAGEEVQVTMVVTADTNGHEYGSALVQEIDI